MAKHNFTPGENKCMEEYRRETAGQPPRKNLLKLVNHINMFNLKPTVDSWEYIFFNRMLTDEMVDFLLKMKLRTPYYIDELAKLEGYPVEDTARLVDEMAHIGIVEYTSDDKGVDMVLMPVFAPGSMETTVMKKSTTDKYPETAPAFLNYILDLQKLIVGFVPMGSALMRALPVEASIKNEPKKAKYEEVQYWLDKAGESIAIAPCECRKLREMVGEGTADIQGDWCMSLGKYAESCIRVGKARRVTREEAENILHRAEELGYVHQVSNIDGPDFSLFICNCKWDSCMALKTSWYTATPNLSASNYLASVDGNNCVACGGCVEVCPQNAIKLGQKLCQNNPVEVKKADIPDNHVLWTKKNWTPDLLTERKNVVSSTGTAPCKSNCPAHVSVQGYLKKASEGKYLEALELIKKENPFPAVCGRVCAKFCEQVCTRGDTDEPVAIDEVKKFIAEQELNAENRFIPKKIFDHGHKIAVIGAGPAGLTCAYYLAVYGHDVTVFEKEALPGGMMRFGIPSFRLEKDVVDAEIEVLKELGVEIKCGVEVGKDVTFDSLRKEGYKGFYVAIGAQGGRKLGVSGEDSDGVLSGIDFLKNIAVGKAEEISGKTVVVGGGNVAIDVARTALRSGSSEVAMYCLESRSEMPASPDEVVEAEEEKISVNCGWGPKEILTDGNKVKAVVFKKCVSVKDASGKFNPKYDENETITVECDHVLAAIGQSVEWNDLLKGTNVKLNGNATAKADKYTYQTEEPDIFVGGDVYTGPRFVIDAIAAGKEGAESLHRYAWDGHSLTLGRVKRDDFTCIDKDNIVISSYDHAQRQVPYKDKQKVLTFADERMTFTEEQIKAETARCLSCGLAVVDTNICIGCGLCTTRCKFDAIKLNKVREVWGVPYEKLVPHVAVTMAGRAKNIALKKVGKDS